MTRPSSTSVWNFGESYQIEYQTLNIADVAIALYINKPSHDPPLLFLTWIYRTTLALGRADWVIPRSVATPYGTEPLLEGDGYQIVVQAVNDPTINAMSAIFSIIESASDACQPGTYNTRAGIAPCTFCPINTYWVNATTCKPCPDGTTTADQGAHSIADCSINALNPLSSFKRYESRYIHGSNAAGVYVDGE